MSIPVVLDDEQEELVSKEELQFLLDIHQVVRFKRSDGWVIVGEDKMRTRNTPYNGKEFRTHEDFSTAQNEVFSLDV